MIWGGKALSSADLTLAWLLDQKRLKTLKLKAASLLSQVATVNLLRQIFNVSYG